MRLTEEQCRARFGGARVARLATLAEDGSPRLVPITFAVSAIAVSAAAVAADISGDVIVSAVDHKPKSTADLARLRRIEREPRVSFLADYYAEDWSQLWWVRADADAKVLTAGADWELAVARLQEKYKRYRQWPPERAVIWAVIKRWSGWAASADRTA